MAAKLKRARCPYCGKRCALRVSGTIWAHMAKGTFLPCGGAGQRPVA
jgi:ribosomal protein L37AE/L43A